MASAEEVDGVLLQVGRFGRFHLLNCLVVNMPVVFSAVSFIAYVFTAQDLTYRCLIPECEQASDASSNASFLPPWLAEAVPYRDGRPQSCARFGLRGNASRGIEGLVQEGLVQDDSSSGACSAGIFDEAVEVRCDHWAFAPSERSTLVSEWDITCEDNKWKLSLVGSIPSIGAIVGCPTAGYLSDRFGRRKVLLWIWVLASLCGLAMSFSSSFSMFLAFESGYAVFQAGTFNAGFLLALELVGPDHRVKTATSVNVAYSSGNVLLGVLAWAVRDWRWLLRAVFGVGLAVALPLWFAPESVRWLAARGRLREADAVVARVAAMNRVPVTRTLVEAVGQRDNQGKLDVQEEKEESTLASLIAVFKSGRLAWRFAICAYSGLSSYFVYFGLSLYSVALSGDQYVNFILTGLVEIPANMLAVWLQDSVGRRLCQAGSLVVAGVCCLAFLAIPEDVQWLQVTTYVMGKFAITLSFTTIFIITAELFPTRVRHSLIGYLSTAGCVGAIVAPQVPLLAAVSEALPMALFGVVSVSGGLLAFLLPETAGLSLPETVPEAEAIGKKKL